MYNWHLSEYDWIGRRSTSFTYPAHTPAAKGTIDWTTTIADIGPDDDLVTATTIIR